MDIPSLYAEALALQKSGKVQDAVEIYRTILNADERHADALHFLGVGCLQLRDARAAIEHIQQAIEIDSTKAAYYNNLGLAYQAVGDRAKATQCFASAIGKQADNVAAHNNIAVVAHELGRKDEADEHFRKADRLRADQSNELIRQGRERLARKDVEGALKIFSQVADRHPDSAPAHLNLGIAYQAKREYDKAEVHFRRALELQPEHVDAMNGLGAALTRQGQAPEAEALLRQARDLRPNQASVRSNLAVAMMEQGQFAEAESECLQAIELDADNGAAAANLGTLYIRMGRLQDGLKALENVLRTQPDLADARWNRALALLALGRYDEGWLEYEWRWTRGIPKPRSIPRPRWDGRSLDGKKVLVHAEQGVGDTIQFLRFAQTIAAQGAEILLACQPKLLPLLGLQPYLHQVVEYKNQLPPFDLHTPLLSMPGILGTTVDTIPTSIPYLTVDSQLEAAWKTRLQQIDGLKVGIVWQGNPQFATDALRSIPLRYFAPLGKLSQVRLISLQAQHGTEQIEELAGELDLMTFPDLDTESGAFMDTAAILKSLDLVICSDTSIAHLAGAIGTPVWLAVSHAPDWRWLVDRSDSPWYPTMRIFRQQTPGDWQAVFTEIRGALEQHVANRSVDTPTS